MQRWQKWGAVGLGVVGAGAAVVILRNKAIGTGTAALPAPIAQPTAVQTALITSAVQAGVVSQTGSVITVNLTSWQPIVAAHSNILAYVTSLMQALQAVSAPTTTIQWTPGMQAFISSWEQGAVADNQANSAIAMRHLAAQYS